MTEIIFSRDITGNNQVLPFLNNLIKGDADLALLITLSFTDLSEAPKEEFPLGEFEPYLVNRSRGGKEVQVELAKQLSEPRIFEMKVDHYQEYHRFIYFSYFYNEENCYVFVYGFTKVRGKLDRTNFYMNKAKEFYNYLRRTGNEEKYFEG